MTGHIGRVADDMFAAVERGDIAALSAMWSDDVTVWRLGGGGARDKGRALKVLDWFVGATHDRHYELLDREVFDSGFVQQHVLHATTHAGGELSLRVCMVVKVATSGLITRIEEYLDPAELAPLPA